MEIISFIFDVLCTGEYTGESSACSIHKYHDYFVKTMNS